MIILNKEQLINPINWKGLPCSINKNINNIHLSRGIETKVVNPNNMKKNDILIIETREYEDLIRLNYKSFKIKRSIPNIILNYINKYHHKFPELIKVPSNLNLKGLDDYLIKNNIGTLQLTESKKESIGYWIWDEKNNIDTFYSPDYQLKKNELVLIKWFNPGLKDRSFKDWVWIKSNP